MRITILLGSKGKVILPISHNEIIQGFIYRNIDEDLAAHIHNRGFIYERRRFRLFTFSRLLGRGRIEERYFKIPPPIKLVVSSPYNEMVQNLGETLLKKSKVKLGDNEVYVESIEVGFAPEIVEGFINIRMLSPVTVYSTLKKMDGEKKTYYYNPKEEEFSELIRKNLIKKYKAFYQKLPLNQELNIEPIKVTLKDEKIVIYKGIIIKGWMGRYRLSGDKELLKLAYDAGLGAKNSQGFGCFEIEG